MDDVKKITALMHYDDAAYIYINGVFRAGVGAFKADSNGNAFDPVNAANITGGNATGAQKVNDPVVNADVPHETWFHIFLMEIFGTQTNRANEE